MLLEGKTVIITGVGGGLGRECVVRALREGANVVVAARTQDTLDALAKELDPEGQRLATRATDITDPEACEADQETIAALHTATDGAGVCARSRMCALSRFLEDLAYAERQGLR